jgi:HD-like signal output (HDOD) protein
MLATDELHTAAFEFVQTLAADLSSHKLQLPGFPDVVIRLQQALGDESTSAHDIVALINTDPALAARMIQLANSAAFNPSGHEISDPRAAITQLGFNVVRSTATAFAMRQMEKEDWLQPLKPQLAEIWRRSNGVAAVCHAIAKRVDRINPDEALATGLFHQLGKLYLMTRAHQEGMEVVGNPAWEEVVQGWHPTIARAILESWGVPEHVAEAAENQNVPLTDEAGPSALAELVAAAKVFDRVRDGSDNDSAQALKTLEHAHIQGVKFMRLAAECRDEIEALRNTIA